MILEQVPLLGWLRWNNSIFLGAYMVILLAWPLITVGVLWGIKTRGFTKSDQGVSQ